MQRAHPPPDFVAPSVFSVELAPITTTLVPGQALGLKAAVRGSDGSIRTVPVSWSSGDESVATVGTHTGVVTARDTGAVTITASYMTFADSGVLLVRPALIGTFAIYSSTMPWGYSADRFLATVPTCYAEPDYATQCIESGTLTLVQGQQGSRGFYTYAVTQSIAFQPYGGMGPAPKSFTTRTWAGSYTYDSGTITFSDSPASGAYSYPGTGGNSDTVAVGVIGSHRALLRRQP